MLSVFYGDMPEAIYDPVVYFKNTYTDEWITDELSREMIRDVDRSIVLGPRVIDSPVLGGISPRELSGGVKTLMDIYKVPESLPCPFRQRLETDSVCDKGTYYFY